MNSKAWFTSFLGLDTIIKEAGQYITRSGELVTVEVASSKHAFECHGIYSTGQSESWHKSGRLLFDRETDNDIVRVAN